MFPAKDDAMRLALFSDIHANQDALVACLAHAREQRADRHAYLGDFVGYGADVTEVTNHVMQAAAAGAVAVRGNHDDALVRSASYFNYDAQAALEWARQTLTIDQQYFLAHLPLIADEGPLCFVHASADHPDRWSYIDGVSAAERCLAATDARFVFCGHVHNQQLYFEKQPGRMSAFEPRPGTAIPVPASRRWLAIVGSVGQPRNGRTAAQYALYDSDRREITFHRVPYDAAAAAARIRAAGLPEGLAYRVEAGI
jgi:diadenosine tetraphosphatase ApaH/serine/threonine PP2A family protein phosphatase